MNAGKVDTLLILGGNPVYSAPADLDFAGALKKVAMERLPGPVPRRNRRAMQLARSRGALSGILGRRARLRRNRQFRAAADRAALRRQNGARSDRDSGGQPGKSALRHRAARIGRAKPKPPTSTSSGPRRCTMAWFPTPRCAAINVTRQDAARYAQPKTGAGSRNHVPSRPDHLGRLVRQQRLAAGAAQACEQNDLG